VRLFQRGQIGWPTIGGCHLGNDLLVEPIDNADTRGLGAFDFDKVGKLPTALPIAKVIRLFYSGATTPQSAIHGKA
jgi:hypothetical protein